MDAKDRRARIYALMEDAKTREGMRVARTIQGLILLSLLTFSLETLPNLQTWQKNLLQAMEHITVAIFLAEYLLRIYARSDDRKKVIKFIFSAYGIIDLIAILPGLPGLLSLGFFDLRLDLRSLRIVRVFRIIKLTRYNKSMQRLLKALRESAEEFAVFGILATLTLFISAVGIHYFEGPAQPEVFSSVFHSLWWAIVTLTTVGYGDAVPITLGGRFFTCIVLFLGLGIIAIPTSILTSAMADLRKAEKNKPAESATPANPPDPSA